MKLILPLFFTQILWLGCFSQQLPVMQNVVVIVADDHALKVTGAYSNRLVRTPSLDKLSNEGITFTGAYCNAPICSASRQSLLTGKYPHATGVNLLFTPFPDQGNVTIAEHLQKHQYKTAIIGKAHWNNWAWGPLYKDGLPNHGFDEVIGMKDYNDFLTINPPTAIPENREYYSRKDLTPDQTAQWMNCQVLPHPIDDAHSSGTFLANQAIDFIKKNRENPFFLWLAFYEPHQPFYFPIEYADKYHLEEMTLPEGSPEDDRWIPRKYRSLTDKEKRGIIASYYTSTEYMDKNLGLVLDALKDLNLDDNTLVVYLSDNGYLLYEHKRFEKHTMWEESVRQPMIFKLGNSFQAGFREHALVEYIDIAPTILDLIGVAPLEQAQGVSFKETIINQTEHKSAVFSEYLQDNLAMVSNKKWKYVFTTGSRDLGIGYQTGYGPSGIIHRLYDLENDPGEKHSVAHLPEHSEVLKKMQQQMLEIFIKTHPQGGACPEGLTLEGKLVWFCEPRDVGFDQLLEDYPIRVFKEEQTE